MTQPLLRLTLITVSGLTSIIISIVAACLRISNSNWLNWGQLALMFCVFASVNLVMLVYTWMRKSTKAGLKVKGTELNLTLFACLIYTLLAARAYHVYANHEAEADLVKYGLPTDINAFTTIAQSLASSRIQSFAELITALNMLLAYFWVANAFAVYYVVFVEKGTAKHHSKIPSDETEPEDDGSD